MSPAHIHLLLNHTPTIGFGIGLCLYLAAYFGKNDALTRASLVLVFFTAVLAIPMYISGNFAELQICPAGGACLPGVSAALIRAHEDAALLAFAFMEFTGFLAWLGLWHLRLRPRLPRWNALTLVVLSLATFGLMGLAANKGGQIRHTEIHVVSGGTVIADDAAGKTGIAKSIGAAVSGATGNDWLWPAAETVHFVGLTLLFTVVLLVNLRILGMAKPLSFQALYRLLPLGMLGFGLNLITGMLFFMGKPDMYTSNVFYWKIVLIVLGGFNVLYFTSLDEVWAIGAGHNAPRSAKAVAASAIILWFGVLYCGHMLPFLGQSF